MIGIIIAVLIAIIAVVLVFFVFKEDSESSTGTTGGKAAAKTNPFQNGIEVGGTVEFGTYEQDGDLSNGPEPIEWEVVKQYDGCYVLLSTKVLDNMYFQSEKGNASGFGLSGTDICWTNSALREWMNNDFYNAAFSENDKRFIADSTFEDAVDKVQVISDEVLYEKYESFSPFWDPVIEDEIYYNLNAMVEATPYAVSRGVHAMTYDEVAYAFHNNDFEYYVIVNEVLVDYLGQDTLMGDYYTMAVYNGGGYNSASASAGDPMYISEYGGHLSCNAGSSHGVRPMIRVYINGN